MFLFFRLGRFYFLFFCICGLWVVFLWIFYLPFMLNAKVESRVMRMIENNKFLQVGLVIFIYFN